MIPQTIGRLWAQYLEARSTLSDDGLSVEKRSDLEKGADQLRDRLLVNYSPLVKYVTGRVSARMTGVVDREDFMSTGLVGLLNAIETYDPEHEAKFETYAISKIRWAMLDEARKEDSLSRRTRTRARRAETARRVLIQQLQREPTEAELAEKSDLSVAEYRDVMQQQDLARTSSLEAQSADDGGRDFGPQIADETAVDPESAVENVERREELIIAMQELSDKERTVVTLYFYQDLTLREIGQALGLTEGRISQILKKTLGKLRGFICEDRLAFDNFV